MKPRNVLQQTGDVQVRQIKHGEQLHLTTVIPIRIARHKFTKVIIQPGDVPGSTTNNWQAQMDANLIKSLCKALYWQEQIDTGRVANLVDIAKREGMDKVRVHKIMKMARLAPRYVEAIAKGKGPIGLSLEFFVRKTLPPNWGEHEELMENLSR
jgi:hypothetical protein